MSEKRPEKRLSERINIRLVFVLSVAIILLVAASVVLLSLYLLINGGVLTSKDLSGGGIWIILLFVLASVIIGTAATIVFTRIFFKPVNEVIDGLNALSGGDYSVRLDLGKTGYKKDISEKFNSLATELQNTTILRSDFINNFSHEFKTPIVSLKGLVELMKRGDVTPQKRKQYLYIIDEELDRLASMATNVLNLSKIESETVLTNVTEFDLSEQIRKCILLLEKKWSRKDIDFDLDLDEYYIEANEELLKEVWINILDNAIKFSEKGGVIKVDVASDGNNIDTTILNHGPKIEEEDIDRIFNKFYSKTVVSAADGNGIGLSVVKHIVDLHGGRVTVKSDETATAFTVRLKRKRKK